MFSIIQAAGWPIWPLIICSILGLALVIERFVSLKTAKIVPPKLLDEAIMVSRNGVPGADVVTHLEQNSALGEVLASGFRPAASTIPASASPICALRWKAPAAMSAAKLQRYLGALATIASAAPLLGLLGTVIGMITIFGSQGGADMGAAAGGGNPEELAHGISIALVQHRFWPDRGDSCADLLALLPRPGRRLPAVTWSWRRSVSFATCSPCANKGQRMNFRPGTRDEPEINLIPFIDVLLVVLIFLMLSTTYSKFTQLAGEPARGRCAGPANLPQRGDRVRQRRWPLRHQQRHAGKRYR